MARKPRCSFSTASVALAAVFALVFASREAGMFKNLTSMIALAAMVFVIGAAPVHAGPPPAQDQSPLGAPAGNGPVYQDGGIPVFEAFNGAWGRRGATKVILADAEESIVRDGLIAAWRNTAPKQIVKEFEGDL